MFSKGTQLEEWRQRGAVERVVTEGAVDHAWFHQVGTEITQVLLTASTPGALATRRNERTRDVIADLKLGDTRTEADDLTSTFVTTDDRQRHRHRAVVGVLVGVAHARRSGLDQDLTGLGFVEFDLFDAPIGADLTQDGSTGLHVGLLRELSRRRDGTSALERGHLEIGSQASVSPLPSWITQLNRLMTPSSQPWRWRSLRLDRPAGSGRQG